jgi:hypothetical protein
MSLLLSKGFSFFFFFLFFFNNKKKMVEAANETKSAKPLENFRKQTHGHAILYLSKTSLGDILYTALAN